MWIGSYKIQKNTRVPYYVIERLRHLTIQLKDEMKARLGCEFDIQIKYSVQSEAAYITIYYKKASHIVSIRAHTTRVPYFDRAYYLNNYLTWNEFKNSFLNNELIGIKRMLKKKVRLGNQLLK